MMAQINPLLVREQLDQGLQFHRSGQLGLARSHYQRALKLDPTHADALHLLGVLALQEGNQRLAIKYLSGCIQHSPRHAEAHNNLGVALRQLERHSEALASFQSALGARERYVEAVYNLGLTYEALNDDANAESAYRAALAWRGNYVEAAIHLGNLLRRNGRPSEALSALEFAQRLAPDDGQTNGSLAGLMLDLGRAAEATRFARRAVAIDPDHSPWWRALGVAQRLQHDVENAIESLRKAIALADDDDTAKIELALALQETGAIEEARALFSHARAPAGYAERLRWTEALSLPAIYRDEAHIDAERARFSRNLEMLVTTLELTNSSKVAETFVAVCGVTPFHLHYQPRDNTQLQTRFGNLVGSVMASVAPELNMPCEWISAAHGERLRIGFVSSHLMKHTVSRYFTALIAGLDPQKFDVRVWYNGSERDGNVDYIASRIERLIHRNDDPLATAREIRANQLDVLIYPEIGMDPRHQVLAALRLAPVQCALYGHPATTGLANVDYFLSGDAIEPLDGQDHYREKLIRLPGLGTRPFAAPAPGSGDWIAPFCADAPLMLCLQNQIKLAPAFDGTLARIAAESAARIGFFSRNPALAQRFRERIENVFTRRGLDPARHLVFLPAQAYAEYLGGIARASLVLDSPWFSGGATSLDALAMGTPVLTLEGTMARGRQTAGMLRAMGINELIAQDEDDYIAKAVALHADATRLSALRERIRGSQAQLFEDDAAIVYFANFLQSSTCGN